MASTPNLFAILTLALWPLVAIILYTHKPINRATLWTILGAQLLLPVGASIKFEGIPQFDKVSIPNLAALVGCILVMRRPPQESGVVSASLRFSLNVSLGAFYYRRIERRSDISPQQILPAETHYDALSAVVLQFISLIPFFCRTRGSAKVR